MRTNILLILLFLSIALFAEQRDGYVLSSVSVNGNNAYLLLPDAVAQGHQSSAPAILLLHDHGARFSIGKEKLAFPLWRNDLDSASNRALQNEAQQWTQKFYSGIFLGDSLAKAGFVVLITDALYWGERALYIQQLNRTSPDSIKAFNKRARLFQPSFYQSHLQSVGEAWFETILHDDQAALYFLTHLPYVDTTHLFCFGFSLGAYRSWQLAASDSRIAACAASCWMNTAEQMGGFLINESSYSMYRPSLYAPHQSSPDSPPMPPVNSSFQPHLNSISSTPTFSPTSDSTVRPETLLLDSCTTSILDYPNIAACIAPRPFLLMYGTTDKVCPLPGTLDACSIIANAYLTASTDASNSFITAQHTTNGNSSAFLPIAFPCAHMFTHEQYTTLLNWLLLQSANNPHN